MEHIAISYNEPKNSLRTFTHGVNVHSVETRTELIGPAEHKGVPGRLWRETVTTSHSWASSPDGAYTRTVLKFVPLPEHAAALAALVEAEREARAAALAAERLAEAERNARNIALGDKDPWFD